MYKNFTRIYKEIILHARRGEFDLAQRRMEAAWAMQTAIMLSAPSKSVYYSRRVDAMQKALDVANRLMGVGAYCHD
jgi:hypothetical protein